MLFKVQIVCPGEQLVCPEQLDSSDFTCHYERAESKEGRYFINYSFYDSIMLLFSLATRNTTNTILIRTGFSLTQNEVKITVCVEELCSGWGKKKQNYNITKSHFRNKPYLPSCNSKIEIMYGI